MEWLTKELFTIYGPLAAGWPLFGWAIWELLKAKKEHMQDVKTVLEAYRTDSVESTKALNSTAIHLEQMARSEDRLAGAVERLSGKP